MNRKKRSPLGLWLRVAGVTPWEGRRGRFEKEKHNISGTEREPRKKILNIIKKGKCVFFSTFGSASFI